MKNRSIQFFLIASLLISGACSDDYQLKQSIFIPDKANPGLPIYSEMGYNTFGSFYDRVAFVSGGDTPAKIIIENDITSFQLIGRRGGLETILILTIPDFNPEDYSDLVELNNRTIDLTDELYSIEIQTNGERAETQIITGFFKFQRAQALLVDRVPFQTILSGTFSFQAVIKGTPVTVESGRFDVGIGTHNFYFF